MFDVLAPAFAEEEEDSNKTEIICNENYQRLGITDRADRQQCW